jgi:hypothetical protein
MELTSQCSIQGCNQPAVIDVGARRVCVAHFVANSYEKLEKLSHSTHTWSVGGEAWESARNFVRECVQSATSFSQKNTAISNLERARLVDIATWATELGRRLRRSPRNTLANTIRLISERPGHCWEEETYTLDISLHGARTKCRHTVKREDILKVLHLDTLEQVEARVVWQRSTTSGAQEIGIEFLHEGGDLNQ